VAGTQEPWFAEWFAYRVLWEIGAGVLGGWLVGRAFGWLTFHVPAENRLAKTEDGLVAGATHEIAEVDQSLPRPHFGLETGSRPST